MLGQASRRVDLGPDYTQGGWLGTRKTRRSCSSTTWAHGAEHDAVCSRSSRTLERRVENRDQNPRAAFGERVDKVNTSDHYSASPLTIADLPNLNLDVMRSFYNARFGNAADFTYFFVGAFTEAEITPLLEKWVASLPSTAKKTSAARDMGVKFPAAVVKDDVNKGKEPASQTLLSFFADPGSDEFELHRLRARRQVLSIRLPRILRGSSVARTASRRIHQLAPSQGYGAVQTSSAAHPTTSTSC